MTGNNKGESQRAKCMDRSLRGMVPEQNTVQTIYMPNYHFVNKYSGKKLVCVAYISLQNLVQLLVRVRGKSSVSCAETRRRLINKNNR